MTNDMTIAREEIFGPVLSVLTYTDEADAIKIANDTPYGIEAFLENEVDHRLTFPRPRPHHRNLLRVEGL